MNLSHFLDAAQDLLAIPSTADRPEELKRALDFVIHYVGPGFTVERFESNGKPSALIYPGATRPEQFRVILNAHLDVVPAEPGQFKPRVEAGRLVARGALDMKVAGLLEALAFKELAPGLPYPMALQLVTDEEVGGHDGTLHQVEQGVRGQFVLFGEQSGLDISVESKGSLKVRLQAAGRSSHGAYPWLGDNALNKLARTIARFLEAYPEPEGEVWRTTVTVSNIQTSNNAHNKVPADATAILDIRYPADDPHIGAKNLDDIATYLRRLCEPGVTLSFGSTGLPHRARPSEPDVAMMARAIRALHHEPQFLRKHGSADWRFYDQPGATAIGFGLLGQDMHGHHEAVEISTIEPYYNILESFLHSVAPAHTRAKSVY